MRRLFLSLAAALLFPALVIAADSTVFRNVQWGMTEAQVVKAETAELSDSGEVDSKRYLQYEARMGGLDCSIVYRFTDAGLVNITVVFEKSTFSTASFVDDFEVVSTLMSKKYGEPTVDDVDWESERMEEVFGDNPGSALVMGKVSYYQAWEPPGTLIGHSLYTDGDRDTWHLLHYEDASVVVEEKDDGF